MRAMRAAVFTQPGRALDIVKGIEIDDPRPGEVLVRIRHCGVCHSDLSIIDGGAAFGLAHLPNMRWSRRPAWR